MGHGQELAEMGIEVLPPLQSAATGMERTSQLSGQNHESRRRLLRVFGYIRSTAPQPMHCADGTPCASPAPQSPSLGDTSLARKIDCWDIK
jgi:hypothetical protein